MTNIIESRDTTHSNQSNATCAVKIDTLPSDMIREPASYLPLHEYMNFARCNRTIYCALNSPIVLPQIEDAYIVKYEWDDFDGGTDYYYQLDGNFLLHLHRFQMLESICASVSYFNKFPQNCYFPHLNKLKLNYENKTDPFEIQVFTNKTPINLNKITHLELTKFGRYYDLYSNDLNFDFNIFCDLLSKFPNVISLAFDFINLSKFDNKNQHISHMCPNLKRLSGDYWIGNLENSLSDHGIDYVNNKMAVKLLELQLIKMYSKQFTALYYHDYVGINIEECCGIKYSFNGLCFDQLNKLSVHWQDDWKLLKQIVSTSHDLYCLDFNDPAGSDEDDDEKLTSDVIIEAFKKFENLCQISFSFDGYDSEYINPKISCIENALLETKETIRKSIKICVKVYQDVEQAEVFCNDRENFDFNAAFGGMTMMDIESYITRIINALDASNTQYFMVKFIFVARLDQDNYRNKIIGKFKSTHLATTYESSSGSGKFFGITISNSQMFVTY
eukprot:98992_1